jgi:hypothetical protein
MDISTPLLNGAMLAVFTVILTWLGKARFDALERRIESLDRRLDRFEESVDRRFDALERRMDQVSADIAQLRSDLLQVALAQGPQPRPQAG